MVSSEIGTNFTVNNIETVVVNYIPTENFWGDYGSIIIGALIAIGIAYIILRRKKETRKRKIKKISKRKKKK